MRSLTVVVLATATLLFMGCAPAKNGSAGSASSALAGQEWELVEVGGSPAPKGAGGRAVTLQLDPAASRASGFGGCNSYSGGITLQGETLSFTAAASTMMACVEGMQVEAMWHRILPLVRRYTVSETELVLRSESGVLARLQPKQ